MAAIACGSTPTPATHPPADPSTDEVPVVVPSTETPPASIVRFIPEDNIAYFPFDGDGIDLSAGAHNGELVYVNPGADRLSNPAHALAFDGM
ncbi:MAG: hypothetical protein FJZ96_05320 [Chloroflexi bacterium]|nr:hypothetical protein [Chloroflexota bacterium]